MLIADATDNFQIFFRKGKITVVLLGKLADRILGVMVKDYAVSSFAEKAEKLKYKQKYEQAEKSASVWKRRFEALNEKYLELKKKAQPYLDALEIASERVRAFLDAVLARGKETRELKTPARKRGRDMEI